MQGGSEVTLSAHATLTSTTTKQVWARPPIDVDFQVLMFTASGLIVRFLKVFEKSNYQSVKWVRYLTKASGSYQVRVSGFVLSLETRDRIVLNDFDVVLRRIYVHVFHPQFHWIFINCFVHHWPGPGASRIPEGCSHFFWEAVRDTLQPYPRMQKYRVMPERTNEAGQKNRTG